MHGVSEMTKGGGCIICMGLRSRLPDEGVVIPGFLAIGERSGRLLLLPFRTLANMMAYLWDPSKGVLVNIAIAALQ